MRERCRDASRSHTDAVVIHCSSFGLGRGADLARGELAVLEQHQRRDRHDAVLRRRRRVLVDVELDDLDLAAERAGDLLERRRDHAAGAAPFGPEIDHDRLGRLRAPRPRSSRRKPCQRPWSTSFLVRKRANPPRVQEAETYGRRPGGVKAASRGGERASARASSTARRKLHQIRRVGPDQGGADRPVRGRACASTAR